MVRESARQGLQGTFNFLWRYTGTNDLEALEFHRAWFEMIGTYSLRCLTRYEDKLMAIFGIASLIQDNTKLIHVSGLWKEMIPLNLLVM